VTGALSNEPLWYQLLIAVIKASVLMGALLGVTGWLVLAERKIIAWLQGRPGPNRAGPMGLFQPVADVLKLLTKEESIPPFVNKILFIAAPAIITITAMVSYAIIPWGPNPVWGAISNLNLGVLLFLALSSLGVYSIVLAGWSSNSKYAVLGGLRATAQMISYELSLSMALLAAVMMAGTLNFQLIVEAQRPFWFILLQPLGFFIFFVSAIAESRRTPFDLPEAENELVAGFHTEYSAMKFALFFGYQGPILPGPVWMILKIAVLFFVFVWIRATYPRFRYDHLMQIGWKWLIPLAVLNLIITAVLCLTFPNLVPNAIH